jgi:monoterpene epsilon-lactone hydrolase
MAGARAYLRLRWKPWSALASPRLRQVVNRPDPPGDVARDHACEVLDAGGARAVWLDRRRAAAGVLVYVHGGTYITGPETAQWRWFGALCDAAGMAGLLLDYRLAPQHPFPAGLEDCEAAIGALERAGDLDGAWHLVGDSAGGGLALAVSYSRRDRGEAQPRSLVLVSPWLDVTMGNPEARAQRRLDPMLSLQGLSRGAVAYAGARDPRDPLISPLFGDPAGLPPLLVHAGTRELFLWDIREYCRRAREAGADVTYVEVEGGAHDFPLYGARVPEARKALAAQAAFVKAR